LYNRSKILRGRTSHAALDLNEDDKGWLYANHSVMLVVRWCDLEGVGNATVEAAAEGYRPELVEASRSFRITI
jgi:hypothetical protein